MTTTQRRLRDPAVTLRAFLVFCMALSGSLAAPIISPPVGSAAAQVRATAFSLSISPEVRQRLEQGTISLGEAVREGLVISSDHQQPTEVVLVSGHLRGGKVVSSGSSQPFRLRPAPDQQLRPNRETERNPARQSGRDLRGQTRSAYPGHDADTPVRQSLRVNRWPFDFPVPGGMIRGGATGTRIPALDLVGRIDQPVFTWAIGGSEDGPAPSSRSSTRVDGLSDLGIYAGGAWIEQSLERSGAIGKLDWSRYEALVLMAIPTDAQERQQSRVQALILPFTPQR